MCSSNGRNSTAAPSLVLSSCPSLSLPSLLKSCLLQEVFHENVMCFRDGGHLAFPGCRPPTVFLIHNCLQHRKYRRRVDWTKPGSPSPPLARTFQHPLLRVSAPFLQAGVSPEIKVKAAPSHSKSGSLSPSLPLGWAMLKPGRREWVLSSVTFSEDRVSKAHIMQSLQAGPPQPHPAPTRCQLAHLLTRLWVMGPEVE